MYENSHSSSRPDGHNSPSRDSFFARLDGNTHKIAAGLLVFVSLLVGLSLVTWSIQDPSLTHTVEREAQNALGYAGAVIADLLMQIFGLVSLLLIVPPLAFSWRLYHNDEAPRIKDYLTSVILILSASAFASSLPKTEGWPLPSNHGGLLGDSLFDFALSLVSGLLGNFSTLALGLVFFILMLAEFANLFRDFDNRPVRSAETQDRTGKGDSQSSDENDDPFGSLSLGALAHIYMRVKSYVMARRKDDRPISYEWSKSAGSASKGSARGGYPLEGGYQGGREGWRKMVDQFLDEEEPFAADPYRHHRQAEKDALTGETMAANRGAYDHRGSQTSHREPSFAATSAFHDRAGYHDDRPIVPGRFPPYHNQGLTPSAQSSYGQDQYRNSQREPEMTFAPRAAQGEGAYRLHSHAPAYPAPAREGQPVYAPPMASQAVFPSAPAPRPQMVHNPAFDRAPTAQTAWSATQMNSHPVSHGSYHPSMSGFAPVHSADYGEPAPEGASWRADTSSLSAEQPVPHTAFQPAHPMPQMGMSPQPAEQDYRAHYPHPSSDTRPSSQNLVPPQAATWEQAERHSPFADAGFSGAHSAHSNRSADEWSDMSGYGDREGGRSDFSQALSPDPYAHESQSMAHEPSSAPYSMPVGASVADDDGGYNRDRIERPLGGDRKSYPEDDDGVLFPRDETASLVEDRRSMKVGSKRRKASDVSEEVEEFELPSLDFLQEPQDMSAHRLGPEELKVNATELEQVLGDFGVRGDIIKAKPGPVVTLYELEPAPGIKSSRVIGLADDIARSMSAVSARVAVVPGRNVIGIELPNAKRETVTLREMLAGPSYRDSQASLPVCLGKTIGGEPVVADLAKMPHLLIAGTTGSGKSVSINTMILSLLYSLTPEQCRLIMIDPKMLELSVYDDIPHLLTPVVTDPKKAVLALKWTVREMEERYRMMSKLGVRNVEGYNRRVKEAIKQGKAVVRTVQTGFNQSTGEAVFERQEMKLEPLPFIVVIVDEMADLMMVAGKEIEGAVQRLAQMARAAGIHIVMATQRPSVDVITGTIKANFPTRISFQVTSRIDSRTILGDHGAEQLLGQGDMLYMTGGGRTVRLHGPFVKDEEVEDIVNHLKAQRAPDYLTSVTSDDGSDEDSAEEAGTKGYSESLEGADLYDQAVAVVLRDKKASTSYVQRRLSIGYNRAASLIERMEKEGVVGPANHAGKREILVEDHSYD